MPHLSELANKYKNDVTFIAISDEEKDTVEEFLKQTSQFDGKTWGEAMEFTVATDPDKSTKNEIFTAAGQRGIPSSFIIRDGIVQWIGHPMGMDEPLHEVVKGTWNHASFRKQHAKQQAAQREMDQVHASLREATKAGDWEHALSILDRAIENHPKRTDLSMQKWMILLTQVHRDDEAYALGQRIVTQSWDNANMLNQIAWTVVDDKNVRTRNLGFAMKAAVRANELTDLDNAAILDTLARVHFEQGNLKTAIHWQRMAVERAGDDQLGDQLRAALKRYEGAGRMETL